MFTGKAVFTALLAIASASISTYAIPQLSGGPGPVVICTCPADTTGAGSTSDTSFAGYKCTYPSGSCVWSIVS